ncbi:hypothetical protein PVL29_024095 [Vitis rotundifolia]|uniref:Uncharacterized protein n=1 Tax=Vitis rotundifolia TaxID=103349 RepID=A0AA39D9C0_VITRO|nr:hypothetical protein PVL29_024095 [Vitis rotundifolia]
MVEDLTHQKELLKTQIKNVEQFSKLFFSSFFKVFFLLLLNFSKLNLDTVIAEARVESKEQAHPQQPLPLLFHDSAPTSALVANPIGPRVTPNLNVSSDETLGPELVAPVAATQARKKRLQIYKVKKPKALPIQINF